MEVEKQSDDDFERANAIEEALVADYGREIVVSVSVSGERVKVNATKVVSKDVLGEGLALELCHAAYAADPGQAVDVHVESPTGMAVRCKGLTGGGRV